MTVGTISFVGGGNMATSLVGGLVADGCSAGAIWVADPRAEIRANLQHHYGVHTTPDNREAAARAETLVFAVKPQIMPGVVGEVAASVREHNALVISVAAGVREPNIRRWLGHDTAIVRTMPNTPALVRSGATAMFANRFVTEAQRSRAESILRAVGITIWVDSESLMDTVTALSGSGPAYSFLLMELLQEAAQKLGLPRETAQLLTLQTAFGAAKMALESPEHPAELRARVTSPGGTTERAMQILVEGGIHQLFFDALKGARERSVELGERMGGA